MGDHAAAAAAAAVPEPLDAIGDRASPPPLPHLAGLRREREGELERFPRSVLVLITMLATFASAVAFLDRAPGSGSGPGSGHVSAFAVLGLLAALTAAGSLHIDFRYHDELEALELFESVLLVVVYALSGPLVVLLAALAAALSEALLRVHPVKAAFNVAQWSSAAAAGGLTFAVLRAGSALSARNLGAVLAAMLVASAVNHCSLILVFGLVRRERLGRVLCGLAGVILPGWVLGGTINLAFGVLFLATWVRWPLAAPLFLLPLGILHWTGRVYAAIRIDRTRLTGMQEATHLLVSSLYPSEAMPAFLAAVRRCFEAEAVELLLADEHGDGDRSRSATLWRSAGADPGEAVGPVRITLTAPEHWPPEHGIPEHRVERPDGDGGGSGAGLPELEPFCVTVLRLGTALRARAGGDSELAARLEVEGWRDCLAAPLWAGCAVGVLCTYNRNGLEGFEEGELTVLEALAAELGTALEKSELLQTIMEERAKLSEIIDHASDGIAALDPDGTVSSWNPGFERITGYRAGDLIGTRGLARLRPRDPAGREVRFECWALERTKLPQVLEVLTPEGERCWISCSYSPVPAATGSQPRRLVITARDVTKERDLQRAGESLRRSAARFRALVQNSSHLVIVLDASARITYASPAFQRAFGYPDEAKFGQNLFDLVHPDDVQPLRARFGEHLALAGDSGAGAMEFRFLGADGSWRHLEALANNLLDEAAVGGIVFNAHDVTERKRAEALLAGQAHVLDLIARDAPLMEVLTALARLIEREADGARCAVLLLDEGGEALTVAAAPSLVDVGLHEADGLVVGPAAGASGTAAWRREPVLCGDVATDPLWAAKRQVALSRGLRAAWAVPIMAPDGDRALGTVTLYFDEPRAPQPFELQLLDLAVHLADIATERAEVQTQLAHQAAHDVLTGLPNRVFFLDRAAHALAATRRNRSAVAVLFLDLDRFKYINDSLGHEAGDRLLVELARRLQELVRPGDTVARFGGDEFVVLCEGIVDEAHALAIAERVAEVATTPFALGGAEVFVNLSIGIAMASGAAARPDTLVENADAAMYRAKARGGNRCEMFDRAMRARAKRRLTLHSSLHRAVERGEFQVVYQPVVALGSRRPVGAEALVRWALPGRGLIPPAEFIGIAEETGLIMPIGTHVLREACCEAERWHAAGAQGAFGDPFCIKVNLSARQFAHPDLVEVIAGILSETSVNPTSVYLEITESVLMEDAESTVTALRDLKALGVSLAVDDFGTGYSSLTYLKRFPVDELKVDRSFVAGLLGDPEDAAIVAAVVNLAHTLGLKAVAEGVESAGQLNRLRELGCDIGQGYYFGRPMPAESMAMRLGLTANGSAAHTSGRPEDPQGDDARRASTTRLSR